MQRQIVRSDFTAPDDLTDNRASQTIAGLSWRTLFAVPENFDQRINLLFRVLARNGETKIAVLRPAMIFDERWKN